MTLTIEESRNIYKIKAQSIHKLYDITPKQINNKVIGILQEEFGFDQAFNAEQYLLGIEILREELDADAFEASTLANVKREFDLIVGGTCSNCNGTGEYRGMHSRGTCYICKGKGKLDKADIARARYLFNR